MTSLSREIRPIRIAKLWHQAHDDVEDDGLTPGAIRDEAKVCGLQTPDLDSLAYPVAASFHVLNHCRLRLVLVHAGLQKGSCRGADARPSQISLPGQAVFCPALAELRNDVGGSLRFDLMPAQKV